MFELEDKTIIIPYEPFQGRFIDWSDLRNSGPQIHYTEKTGTTPSCPMCVAGIPLAATATETAVKSDWMPKVGDRVRVLRNTCNALLPDRSRLLVPGDIIEICNIDSGLSKPVIRYEVADRGGHNTNYVPIRDVEPVAAVQESCKCTCDMITLMRTGCQCGQIQRERQHE